MIQALLLCLVVVVHGTSFPVTPVSVLRGLSDPQFLGYLPTTDDTGGSLPDCQLEMDQPIVLSHPQSIDKDDRYYVLGSTSYEAVVMVVDYINTQRCGVHLQGKNYPLLLHTMGDDSDPVQHKAIAEYLVNRTEFFLAGYSSLLTQHLAPVADQHQRIMVAAGSARTAVYQDRPYTFGILPPGHLYLEYALQAVARHGATTVAAIAEDGFGFICNGVPALAERFGLELINTTTVSAKPGVDELMHVANDMAALNPDVVVTCTLDTGCARWIQSMRQRDWSPKAQVFTLCMGQNEVEQAAGDDVHYMMGASSWDRNLPPVPDAVTGWTPGDFAKHFEAYAFKNATYQNAAAATSVSVLVQAMELVDSRDTDLVKEALATHTFVTMYGETSFNDDGQNAVPSNVFQYDGNMDLHIVYPPEKASDTFSLVYPMPTFRHRDCSRKSTCETLGGACRKDGTCDCSDLEHTDLAGQADHEWSHHIISRGLGANATCKVVPNEDYMYMDDAWKIVGQVLVAFQAFLSLVAIVWTLVHLHTPIVAASQPIFLIFVAIGCFIMVSSILPTSVETGYRYIKDETTGLLTTDPNPDIRKADAACMQAPWLAGMGFAIVFSALFAKIRRIKKMVDNAAGYNRKPVAVHEVIGIMIVVILIQTVILLSWQLIDPLRWEREVLLEDSDGFAIQSVGGCQSESVKVFVIPFVSINVASLGYALWLCYLTRFVPSDFAEGKWIAISVVSAFQILLLAIPILVIAQDDTTASYFVRASVVSLLGTTITLLIFVPKIARLAAGKATDGNAMRVRFSQAVATATANRQAPSSASPSGTRARVDQTSLSILRSNASTPVVVQRPPVISENWGRLTVNSLNDSDYHNNSLLASQSSAQESVRKEQDATADFVKASDKLPASPAEAPDESSSSPSCREGRPGMMEKIRQRRVQAWGLSGLQQACPNNNAPESGVQTTLSKKGNPPPLEQAPGQCPDKQQQQLADSHAEEEEGDSKRAVEAMRRAQIQAAIHKSLLRRPKNTVE